MVDDIRGNRRRKLLIFGQTGDGKSSLCNVLTGSHYDADIFPIDHGATAGTQETTFANANYIGDPNKLVSIIDTAGFDSSGDDPIGDAESVGELERKLTTKCDHINLFLMVVNGESPKLKRSLLTMIRTLTKLFSQKFWDHVALVFTRLSMDNKTMKKRLKNKGGRTDETVAVDYMAEVEQQFPGKGQHLKYFFIDSCYDMEDEN